MARVGTALGGQPLVTMCEHPTHVWGRLLAEAAALGRPSDRVGREEVDQINIIARWVHHHSEDDERAFFKLPRALGDSAEATRFVERVTAALLRAPEDEDAATSEYAEAGVPAGDEESER